MRVLKGHGTENDFVVVPDLDGVRPLDPRFVRAVCDRRAGIGADGVLRVVRSVDDPEALPMAGEAEYFMDYRNADGSLAQMCGNGVRVFARYLQRCGLAGARVAVATRGGVKLVWGDSDDLVVDMGAAELGPAEVTVVVGTDGPRRATAVFVPNPHAVTEVAGVDALVALDLSSVPAVDSPLSPTGQNVEFVTRLGPRHLRIRVHERGVGETRSCGTGICAVVAAVASADGSARDGVGWRVDVPGGTCTVRWRADGHLELSGPAEIVAEIDLDPAWLAAAVPAAASVSA